MQSLSEKKILITRPTDQANGFLRMLENKDAEVFQLPMIELVASTNEDEKKQALNLLDETDWLIFTSVNAVKFFFQSADQYGTDFSFLPNIRIATVGEKTKKTLEELGYRTNFVPNNFSADMLVKQIPDVEGRKILIPRSAKASNQYVKDFEKRGAEVKTVVFYENEKVVYFRNDFIGTLRKKMDYITFTSGSTVRAFHEYCQKFDYQIESEKVIVIGPSTAKVAEELGIPVKAVAETYTIEGILEEIEKDVRHAKT